LAKHAPITPTRVLHSDDVDGARRSPRRQTQLYWRTVPAPGDRYSDIMLISAVSLEDAAELFWSPAEAVHECTAPGLLALAAAHEAEELWTAPADQLGPGVVARSVAFLS